MTTHVKVLGVLYLAMSALALLAAMVVLLAIGGAAATVGVSAEPQDAAVALPILGLAGTAVGVTLLLLALPGIATGLGLLYFKPWARILGIVLSVLNLINIPLGTIVGAYGLWVLLNKDTERLFTNPTISSPL
jgi:hypothetical protein